MLKTKCERPNLHPVLITLSLFDVISVSNSISSCPAFSSFCVLWRFFKLFTLRYLLALLPTLDLISSSNDKKGRVMLNLQQQYVKNSPCVVLCLFVRSFFFSFSFFAVKVK